MKRKNKRNITNESFLVENQMVVWRGSRAVVQRRAPLGPLCHCGAMLTDLECTDGEVLARGVVKLRLERSGHFFVLLRSSERIMSVVCAVACPCQQS